MTDQPKTPDLALSEQAEPQQPITFQFKGKTVTLDIPFTTPVWFWILTHTAGDIDPNEKDDSLFKALFYAVGLHGDRILSVATHIPLDELKAGVKPKELDRVMNEMSEQLGRELTAASPFSNCRAALQATNRGALLAHGAKGSRGRRRSSQSKPNSAAGRKRRQTA